MTIRIMTDAGLGITPKAELILPVRASEIIAMDRTKHLSLSLNMVTMNVLIVEGPIQLSREYRTILKMSFVLHSATFLLPRVHPHAQHAAESAEAAGAQGMFWEMHDMLYENQAALDDPSLREYALALELDMDRFDTEIMTHAHANRVREDFRSGVMSGVNGTPTFYLNGIRYDGSWDGDSLRIAIEELIVANRRKITKRRR